MKSLEERKAERRLRRNGPKGYAADRPLDPEVAEQADEATKIAKAAETARAKKQGQAGKKSGW